MVDHFTNGKTERFNKTLIGMLRIYADKHKQRWDQFLQPVLLAYRTSINASIKETPLWGATWLHGLRQAQGFARISLEKEKMRQEAAPENERGAALTQLIHVSQMKEYKGGQNTPTEAPEVDDDFDPSLEEEATSQKRPSADDPVAPTNTRPRRRTRRPQRFEDFEMNTWDTAGQERYRTLAPMYYRGSHAGIIVFDVTDRASFESVSLWLNALVKGTGNDSLIVAVVANKVDLPRVVSTDEAVKFVSSLPHKSKPLYFETSTKTGQGVSTVYETIARAIFELFHT
ncbi:GTP-binding protein YPT52 [Pelomyxa schiedti]|nr:GTP-binding protein YPT52 [Pelomyxa schiedti]